MSSARRGPGRKHPVFPMDFKALHIECATPEDAESISRLIGGLAQAFLLDPSG